MPQEQEWKHRGAAGSAAPTPCRGEVHAVLPQSHPQLPLLVEIGIKPCLGIVLGDIRKSGLTEGSQPGHHQRSAAQPAASSSSPATLKTLIARVSSAHHTFTLKVPSSVTLDSLALPIQMGLLSNYVALPWVPVLFTLSAADTHWQT